MPVFFMLITVLGATRVWTVPADVSIMPQAEKRERGEPQVRLYTGRGELEAFQIAIEAGRHGLEGVELVPEPLDKEIGPPDAWLVGYAEAGNSGMEPRGALQPDPLLPLRPFDVPARQTRAIWVRYRVPAEASPGIHRGSVTVRRGKRWRQKVEVTIEVFDLELKTPPVLRTAFLLDTDAVIDLCAPKDLSLEAWRPFYDSLAPQYTGLTIWSRNDAAPVRMGRQAELERFKEHLEYIFNSDGPSTIDIGIPQACIAAPETPQHGGGPDPLGMYLTGMADWLADHGRLETAYVEPMPMSPRETWNETQASYVRVGALEPRMKRLFVGALHPYFEDVVDIWAVSLENSIPMARQRLIHGLSLTMDTTTHPAAATVSSIGPFPFEPPYKSRGEDACDGSVFTAWCSGGPPTDRSPERLRLDFDTPVYAEKIVLYWLAGREAMDIRVRTAFNGTVFSPATVRWDHRLAGPGGMLSRSEGQLKVAKTLLAVEFEFRSSAAGRPLALAEARIGDDLDDAASKRIAPKELWLHVTPGGFPSLGLWGRPIEARSIGWVCWDNGMTGLKGGSLNTWPTSWKEYMKELPLVWRGAERGQDYLYYPSPNGFLPSIRSELLREGIEDYGCFAALAEAVQKGEAPASKGRPLQGGFAIPLEPSDEELAAIGKEILTRRVAIGRLLTQAAKERGR
jgi:hypothetical protein